MYTFEHSTFINRPPQEVHDFITNPANTPPPLATVSGETAVSSRTSAENLPLK